MSRSKLTFPTSEDFVSTLVNVSHLQDLLSPKNRKKIKSLDWSMEYADSFFKENPSVTSLLMVVRTDYYQNGEFIDGYVLERFFPGEIHFGNTRSIHGETIWVFGKK